MQRPLIKNIPDVMISSKALSSAILLSVEQPIVSQLLGVFFTESQLVHGKAIGKSITHNEKVNTTALPSSTIMFIKRTVLHTSLYYYK